jgi:hypothetical protein
MRYPPAPTLQFPSLKLHQLVYRRSGGRISSRIERAIAVVIPSQTMHGGGEEG